MSAGNYDIRVRQRDRDWIVETWDEVKCILTEIAERRAIRFCVAIAERDAEIERLHSKLQRVADWLRHEANSPGGLAAEIECVLKGGEG